MSITGQPWVAVAKVRIQSLTQFHPVSSIVHFNLSCIELVFISLKQSISMAVVSNIGQGWRTHNSSG